MIRLIFTFDIWIESYPTKIPFYYMNQKYNNISFQQSNCQLDGFSYMLSLSCMCLLYLSFALNFNHTCEMVV